MEDRQGGCAHVPMVHGNADIIASVELAFEKESKVYGMYRLPKRMEAFPFLWASGVHHYRACTHGPQGDILL